MQASTHDRTRVIITWLGKIEKSKLAIREFFKKNNVPFSLSQYYVYLHRLEELGERGIRDGRREAGRKKLSHEAEAFIAGCIERDPGVSPL